MDAPKPFQAAQVHLMNVDKNVLFMVYTSGGRYQAINLFPGNYEVSVVKRGFAADPKKIAVKAGETISVDFSLREAPPQEPQPSTFGGPQARAEQLQLGIRPSNLPPSRSGRAGFVRRENQKTIAGSAQI